jgi:hypothetical protein
MKELLAQKGGGLCHASVHRIRLAEPRGAALGMNSKEARGNAEYVN